MTKKDVAEKQNTAVSVPDYGEYSGQGFEGTDSNDIIIPFIACLQGLSPQCEEREDCRPGHLFNTVTDEVTTGSMGILFVPAVVGRKEFVQWIPRKRGGGLVARHAPESDVVKAAIEDAKERGLPFGKLETPGSDGQMDDLVETKYIYGVEVDEQTHEPKGFFCLAFTSTKIKIFNAFNTRLQTVRGNPPPFAHLCRLTTKKETNEHGDFYNYQISAANGSIMESLLPTDNAGFKAGLDCYNMVNEGTAVAAFETQQKAGGAETEEAF